MYYTNRSVSLLSLCLWPKNYFGEKETTEHVNYSLNPNENPIRQLTGWCKCTITLLCCDWMWKCCAKELQPPSPKTVCVKCNLFVLLMAEVIWLWAAIISNLLKASCEDSRWGFRARWTPRVTVAKSVACKIDHRSVLVDVVGLLHAARTPTSI